jgi:hypothetical protein
METEQNPDFLPYNHVSFQFIFVQLFWLLLHILFWKGPVDQSKAFIMAATLASLSIFILEGTIYKSPSLYNFDTVPLLLLLQYIYSGKDQFTKIKKF